MLVAAVSDRLGRLDRFVVDALAGRGDIVSRAEVQRWIAKGRVTLDGRAAAAADRVREGARVVVVPMPPEPSELVPDPSVRFDVLFEDDHLIVVDKPPGLVVHPARGHAQGTLVHGLLARGSFDRSDLSRSRPGIVHRLDKGTSGILVVAKDERTREGLKWLFSRHDIARAYVAIVVGRAVTRTYETLHGRDPANRLKFTTRVAEGKRAVTHVRASEALGGATLVECTLETGRTHQIRVHLAERSRTPVLGDPLYGAPPSDPALAAIAATLGRQALHATLLGFAHPITGAPMRFEREPPADFKSALAALRLRPREAPGGAPS
jgi:23S rRNA pseudouridine1911/1915/1917 synthase